MHIVTARQGSVIILSVRPLKARPYERIELVRRRDDNRSRDSNLEFYTPCADHRVEEEISGKWGSQSPRRNSPRTRLSTSPSPHLLERNVKVVGRVFESVLQSDLASLRQWSDSSRKSDKLTDDSETCNF